MVLFVKRKLGWLKIFGLMGLYLEVRCLREYYGIFVFKSKCKYFDRDKIIEDLSLLGLKMCIIFLV